MLGDSNVCPTLTVQQKIARTNEYMCSKSLQKPNLPAAAA